MPTTKSSSSATGTGFASFSAVTIIHTVNHPRSYDVFI